MPFKGKEFSPEMIHFVVGLRNHFTVEKKSGATVSTKNPTLRTAEGLGIGEATVKRIMARYNRDDQRIVIPQSKPCGKPVHQVEKNLQPVIRQYIRSHNLRGQRISIEKVRSFLAQEHEAEISATTLWRTLNRWGFTHGVGARRSALKERDYVVRARRNYLRIKRANRNIDGTLKRPEVYLDETYINQNHSGRFTWYLKEDGPWVNKPSGKGPRLIIVNAITTGGWVDGAELVFQAKKRTGDYHGQMNWENFSKWFESQLIPNIPTNSIIIMDNAKYHNVLAEGAFSDPSTNKQELREWLSRNEFPWTVDMLKPELLALCKRFAPVPEFKLDKIAKNKGHRILRTPQYHPELQPIETCWAVVKNYMSDNCDFTIANLRALLPNGFGKVTPKTCRGIIKKVIAQEDKFWVEDEKLDIGSCDKNAFFNDGRDYADNDELFVET
jgi:transposase